MPNEGDHIKYMKRCLELAALGQQNVSPNPMVGAVLVYEDRIIGEGFHEKFGEPHAEVNAINSVKTQDQELISKSTLYVSLEPCSHHGKTPPCSDLIVRSNVPNVVIGCMDTFSEVAGKGIEKLEANGIDVTVGILEKEARELNKRFFTFHEKQRPYIILKWAKTADGFIDKVRNTNEAQINWITQPETQQLTHQWRAEEDAILVGHQTVINDNPSLTVRAAEGKNPIRIVLSDSIPEGAKVYDESAQTIFIDARSRSIADILNEIYNQSIQSIIIEGGKTTLEQFIENNFWDEARVLTGKIIFEEGIKAPEINGVLISEFTFGKDIIQLYNNA